MLSDFKSALRHLAKSPGFSAVAILTLAVAIGVNSAIFSLINCVLLRPAVPFRPAEVVNLFTTRQDAARAFRQFSYAEFTALRQTHEVFSDVAAVNFNSVSLGRDEGLHRNFAFMVSANFFSLMGVQPAAGRFFTDAETRPNAGQRVVVASHALWQRNGGRVDFIGSTLLINGQPHVVIGVSPEGFSGVSALVAPDLWLPFGLFSDVATSFSAARKVNDLANPQTYTLNLMGRMVPGLTIESARPRLPMLAARLTAIQPPESASARELVLTKPFSISPNPEDPGPLRLIGVFMLSMSGIVLLIACLNLANMMLARSSRRAAEMAVRLALGASRGRIVRLLVTEGFVLAVCGGALGLLLSLWASAFLQNFFAALLDSMGFTLSAHLQPDLLVVAVTFLFCLFATLVFSLGPALKAARAGLVHDLKAQPGDPAAAGRWNRFFSGRHLMVMVQMTLSLVLLFCAGLFVRTAVKAGDVGTATGFTTEGVVMAQLDFSLANTSPSEATRRMLAAAGRLREQPGVRAAGLSTLVPYNSSITTTRIVPATAAPAVAPVPHGPKPGIGGIFSAISSGYFDSIGVHLLRGRDFTDNETRATSPLHVCIIDEGMAEKLFPGGDALGQRVRYVDPPAGSLPGDMEVVGIVNRHCHGLEDKGKPVPGIYVPLGQAYNPTLFLSIRSLNCDPAAVLNAIGGFRQQLHQLDPDLPVMQMLPFTDFTALNFTQRMVRLGAIMFGVFGGIALLLATLGVYGVKAYAVQCRTREIGIRVALGAARSDVFSLIMSQGALQTAVSVGVGVVLCALIGRALASVFFQVSPMDPVVLSLSAAILASATLLACFLSARRATKVDPMIALRAE